MTDTNMVWAFNWVDNDEAREMLYNSINEGKSRFGFSEKEDDNLKAKGGWSKEHSFLLEIKKGDWIVHINTPEWGKCIAGKVTSEYDFDGGLPCSWGSDFRHNFSIDRETIIPFYRTDPNVLPSVNLRPRSRYHRVYEVDDFLQSIENIKNEQVSLRGGESAGEHHLRNQTEKSLKEITNYIRKMHPGKKLEGFLAKVMRAIPNVIDVEENGFGWGSGHGADLIVTLRSGIGGLDFENKIIVQIKSYDGKHFDLGAVEQIKDGIKEYDGTAGMLITTAENTKELEKRISNVSNEIGKPIDLLCGVEVARFVLKNAPKLLFKL